MRIFTGVGLLFYVLIISFGAGITMLYVGHVFLLDDVVNFLTVAYRDTQVRWFVGGLSGALIFLSFVFARVITGGRQKERTIAFDNPTGRVMVSLGAVEDLVKRLMNKLPEIRDVKLHILKTKKGIEAECRLILKTDVNIPEMTSRLQDLVKNKIEEILGIEEPVIVRVHVVKIVSDDQKEKRSKENVPDDKGEPSSIPYHGFRR